MMFLKGCGEAQVQIPSELLQKPSIPYREIKTQNDVGIFLIDLYRGYDECGIMLDSIKRIYYGN